MLIGATTENPSFEVNAALLSRSRVFVLRALTEEEILSILERALADVERGLGAESLQVEPEALGLIARASGGDARSALNLLELAASSAPAGDHGARSVDRAHAEQAIQRRMLLYDKGGEEHYNIISALHKSMRNSDPDAALYWLARMLEAGEDPLYIARRLVRFASEDVGMADPQALTVAIAAKDATHFLGMPEGNTALAQAAVYLATAPKSNAIYLAYRPGGRRRPQRPAEPVPLHLRNAPTKLMKDLDYGRGLPVRARCARRGHRHGFAAGLARGPAGTTSRPAAGSRRRSSGGWRRLSDGEPDAACRSGCLVPCSNVPGWVPGAVFRVRCHVRRCRVPGRWNTALVWNSGTNL